MTNENALKRNGELANLSATSYETGPLQKSVSRGCLQMIVPNHNFIKARDFANHRRQFRVPAFLQHSLPQTCYETGQSLMHPRTERAVDYPSF
jgi:hypothetical protein